MPCDDEEAAHSLASKFRYSRWRIEKRMVGPWTPTGPTMQSRVVVEVAEQPSGALDGQVSD